VLAPIEDIDPDVGVTIISDDDGDEDYDDGGDVGNGVDDDDDDDGEDAGDGIDEDASDVDDNENNNNAQRLISSRTYAKLMRFLRFPLVVLMSFALSLLLYTLAGEYFFAGELGLVSRRLSLPWEYALLYGWRTFELAFSWWSKYDGELAPYLSHSSLYPHPPPLPLLRASAFPTPPPFSASLGRQQIPCVPIPPYSLLDGAGETTLIFFSSPPGVDLACLTLLSHLPSYFLLTNFYSVSPSTTITMLLIDMTVMYVPFRLLRPLLPAHAPLSLPLAPAPAPAPATSRTRAERPGRRLRRQQQQQQQQQQRVPNRPLIADMFGRVVTSLLAASIYAVVLLASYRTWLPVHLVTRFAGLRDVRAAHAPPPLPLFVAALAPAGYAAREFLFTPFAARAAATRREAPRVFDPARATLRDTLRFNLWGGYSSAARFLLRRLAVLVAATAAHTWLHSFFTLDGAESAGAVGWAGLWSAAAVLSGLMFWWVGGV
jgi:hypothetical protein